MKKLAMWTRGLTALLVVTCTVSLMGAGAPLGYIKTHTLQNLGPSPSKFMGHYLAIDDAGIPLLSRASSSLDAESYWEIKYYFWKDRGYTTHTIIQRGNNRYNGKYLCIDSAGKLAFADEPVASARWLVRYAGKYQGWDATQIQNLAENGLTDMAFLAIDEATGEVILTPKPTPGSYWFMNDTSYLPAETMVR